MQGYNGAWAQTTSTAALPLVEGKRNASRGYDEEDAFDYDRKEDFNDDYLSNPSRALVDEERSLAPSGYTSNRGMFDARNMPEKDGFGAEKGETAEVIRMSSERRRWVFLTWLFTWWVPGPFLKWFGGMKRPDVRMAWREKLLIKFVYTSYFLPSPC